MKVTDPIGSLIINFTNALIALARTLEAMRKTLKTMNEANLIDQKAEFDLENDILVLEIKVLRLKRLFTELEIGSS